MKKYTWGKPLGFGKYRDKTIREIFKEDAEYLGWLIECRINGFRMMPELEDRIKSKARRDMKKYNKKNSFYIYE